jgi:hypothetical protein
MQKFIIMKSKEVTNVYEIEADSKEEAIRMARMENPPSQPIEVQSSKWNLVHIDDGNGDVEEWTPSYT